MVDIPTTIRCTTRQPGKKGASHKLRATGQVPLVAYGPGRQPQHLSVNGKMFLQQRERYGLTRIYDVEVEGQQGFKALIKHIQFDPLTQFPLHVDLYAVDMTRAIRVPVPVELLGKPVGVVDGGILNQILRYVEVQCLPDKVPQKLTVDVTPLKIGGAVHLKDLQLPPGVELTSRRDEAVATVVPPEEEEVAATPATAEGAVPGAEGAVPAEGAAAGAEGEAAAAAPAEGAAKGAPAAGKKEAADDKKGKKGKKD